MHFKTIKRDEVLPMLEQAMNKTEQKKILCDLLDCRNEELEKLIKELESERAANKAKEKQDMKKLTAKVARDDEYSDVSAYAKFLEEELNAVRVENSKMFEELTILGKICDHAFNIIELLRKMLKERTKNAETI